MGTHQYRLIRLCLWSCVLIVLFFFLFWGIIGQNLPPRGPDFPLEDLVIHFSEHSMTLRLAYVMTAFSSVFFLTWGTGIFALMRHIDPDDYVLPYMQLISASFTGIPVFLAGLFWLAAAFRPETAPILLLHDLGWFFFDLGFAFTTIQMVSISVFFMYHQRLAPTYPAWICWVGIWVGLGQLLFLLVPFFYSGPFAWAGLFNFWIEFSAVFFWVVFATIFLYRTVGHIEQTGAKAVKSSSR